MKMRSSLKLDITHSPDAVVPRLFYRGIWVLFIVYFTVGIGLILARVVPPFGAFSDFLFIFLAALVVFLTEVRISGWAKAGLAFVWVGLISGLIETVGTLSGIPFGGYTYTEAFGPRLWGILPIAIPLAWWLILMPVYRLLETYRQRSSMLFIALVAIVVTGVDFVIEPVAVVIKGYWIWQSEGFYYGVPWSNFGGWLLTALVLTIGLIRMLPKVDLFAPPSLRPHGWLLTLVIGFFIVVLLRDGIYPPVLIGISLLLFLRRVATTRVV
jgi:putative membrane protein